MNDPEFYDIFDLFDIYLIYEWMELIRAENMFYFCKLDNVFKVLFNNTEKEKN